MGDIPAELVLRFETEGQRVLGFDTGLSAQAFAKARLGSLMSSKGLIVDSALHIWKPEGALDHQGHMVIFGSAFEGQSLEGLLSQSGETALVAMQRYLGALKKIAETDETWFPTISLFPAGVFISDGGQVFFTPLPLATRIYEYRNSELYSEKVARWLHPDKKGTDAARYTATALLYWLFSGASPFSVPKGTNAEKTRELLAQDMRDGLFTSIGLTVPTLTPSIVEAIDRILLPESTKKKTEKPLAQPSLKDLSDLIGQEGTKHFADFFAAPPDTLSFDTRKRVQKQWESRIKFRRFFRTYKYTIIAGIGTAMALLLFGRSILNEQKQRPSTLGMGPRAVTEAYYKAFNTLDHQMMDACVAKGIGKGDIEVVMNFFVISRVREAYERKTSIIDPETWKKQGSPETEASIFGITDLALSLQGQEPPSPAAGDRCQIEASYCFYYPKSSEVTEALPQNGSPQQTVMEQRRDLLTLEWVKDRWRIAAIEREIIHQSDIP